MAPCFLGWSLDEDQRSRLLELHQLLGEPLPFGTASAMLGFLLAASVQYGRTA